MRDRTPQHLACRAHLHCQSSLFHSLPLRLSPSPSPLSPRHPPHNACRGCFPLVHYLAGGAGRPGCGEKLWQVRTRDQAPLGTRRCKVQQDAFPELYACHPAPADSLNILVPRGHARRRRRRRRQSRFSSSRHSRWKLCKQQSVELLRPGKCTRVTFRQTACAWSDACTLPLPGSLW